MARGVEGRDSKFRQEGKLALLAGRNRRRKAVQSSDQRAVVSQKLKWTTLQLRPEVKESLVGGQQFTVKSGIFALGG